MADNAVLSLLKNAKTKVIPFGDGEIEVRELTAGQVVAFSAKSEALAKEGRDETFEETKETLYDIIRAGVVGMEGVSDADLDDVPIRTLKDLSTEVMTFNGLAAEIDVEEGNVSAQAS